MSGYTPTNAGQPFDAQSDVQDIKDSLTGSGTIPVVAIAGSAATPGLCIGESTNGFFRPATGRFDASPGGTPVTRFSPTGVTLGTLGDARTYIDVKDPYSAWTANPTSAHVGGLFTMGNFALSTLYRWHQDAPGAPSNDWHQGAMAGCVEIPTTGRKGGNEDSLFRAGVIGLARNSSPASSSSPFGLDGVGVYGQASALEDTSQAFGGNFLVDDRVGKANAKLWGVEIDANVYVSSSRVFGLDVVGVFYAAPAFDPIGTNAGLDGKGAHAVRVAALGADSSTDKQWTYGFITTDGAAKNGIVLGTVDEDTSDTSASQPIVFRGRTGSTVYVPQISGGADGSLINQIGKSDGSFYILRSDGSTLIQVVPTGASTNGIAIQQGTTSGGQPAFLSAASSGDVAHGMTSLVPTDVYVHGSKFSAGSGGVLIRGLTEATVGINLQALGVTDDTGTTSTASAYAVISAVKRNGAGPNVTSPASTANLMTIADAVSGTGTRFIFKNDGNAYADASWTTFDTHDDIALLDALEHYLDPTLQRDALGYAFRGYDPEELERVGLVGRGSVRVENGRTRGMVNLTGMVMVLAGAVRQLSDQLALTQRQLSALEGGVQ